LYEFSNSQLLAHVTGQFPHLLHFNRSQLSVVVVAAAVEVLVAQQVVAVVAVVAETFTHPENTTFFQRVSS
jgi:hypothetical protein